MAMKPISMDDRYRAADRIARVLKRWPLSPNDILEYLAISSVRAVRVAIGFYFLVFLLTMPMLQFSDVPQRKLIGGLAVTAVVLVALIVAHQYLMRLRDSACSSGPQPWLRYLNVCRWVLIALAVGFFALGAWLFYQKYTGSTLVGLSDLSMPYWESGLAALFGLNGCIGVLAWLKLPPPSLPAPTQPVESLQPWVRSSYVVPDKLAAFRVGTRVVIMVVTLVVMLIVGGVVVWWVAIKPPNGQGWSPAMATGALYSTVYDFGTPGVAVISTGQDSNVEGIDLATRAVLWSRSGGVSVAGDAADVVVISGSQLDVIDATTGTVKTSADLSNSGSMTGASVLWVGVGRVLYQTSYSAPLCDASLDDPGNCSWTAPSGSVDLAGISGPNLYVFGGGTYVNTGDGVVMMATGQPASFGADAGQTAQGGGGVYYTGPSTDRVFRVVPSSRTSSYQPWDTAKDTAISPAVTATQVLADPAASSYLATDSSSFAGLTQPVTAYDWQTGQQLWKNTTSTLVANPTQFANGAWLATINRTSTVKVLVALDPATGREVWHGRSNSQLVGVAGNTVFATDGWTKLWSYDMANNFKATKSIGLPSRMCTASVAGGRVICLDQSSGSLWVMDN